MPEFEAPVTNRVCWVELQTRDLAAARSFYGGLFGWTFEDLPLPQGSYTVAKINGKQVGGLTPLPEALVRAGTAPSWGSYIGVDDVQASSEAAARHGGQLLLGPRALGPGTFSVIADPTGAVILLWHTTQPIGTFLYGEPGSCTWNELVSTNPDVAQRYYAQLFGWKAAPQQTSGQPYTLFKSGGAPVGGLMAQPPDMKGLPSRWVCYFAVNDPDVAFTRALRSGARVIMPMSDLPQMGRFGWLADPQGALFAIIKNAAPTTIS
jgi:uncharacterized protein